MDFDKVTEYEKMFSIMECNEENEENNVMEDSSEKCIICKECNLPATTHGHDIWECANCGCFMEQMIDNSAEWRNYSEDGKDNVRCSVVINRLLPQSSKGTIILQGPSTNNNMRRSQKVHSWSAMTYKERCLNNIFKDISLRSLNGCILSNVTKLAHEYYKIISELHVARGIMRKGLIAACLFMACKKQGVPRTCQEIAEIFQIDDKWVTKGNKKFTELWSLTGKGHISYKEDCQSQDYLARFCSNLLEEHTELLTISRKISNICKSNDLLSQNTPISVAASSIYIATIHLGLKDKISRLDIANAAKTSQVTISKCFKELMKTKDIWKENEIVVK
tara:strand:- start:1934 stop:2938 length:1005 start_codon:yes stop_codon:yes gene_type:complete